MKAIPIRLIERDGLNVQERCEPKDAQYLILKFPSDDDVRMIPVQPNNKTRSGAWSWNCDTEKVTIRPSVLADGDDKDRRWHCWLNDGIVSYLSDSIPDFANKHIPLDDIPKEWLDMYE